MHIGVVTLFPEMLSSLTDYGVTGRAVDRGLLTLDHWNPRSFTLDRHQTVDDRPYGGGPGMVMQIDPLRQSIQAAKATMGESTRVVYMSPQGKMLKQAHLQELSQQPLLLLAGRYEGVDERLISAEVDEELSIGDYVLSGGELAAMVVIDAMARLIPGALGHEQSAEEDSFSDGLLDCPHYTRPQQHDLGEVPSVLMSGDHEAIRRWRLMQSLGRTWERRPDLLEGRELNKEQTELLTQYQREHQSRDDKL